MTLYLLPNLLAAGGDYSHFFPPRLNEVILMLDALIAESEKGGRHFLRGFKYPEGKTFRDTPTYLLNEHTKSITELLDLLKDNKNVGLVSDCGLPVMADPGAKLIAKARKMGVNIETVPGPSSIVSTLLLSGLPGQQFCFHGYLSRNEDECKRHIKDLQKMKGYTHMFIDAPYRNERTLRILLETLRDEAYLTVASDLTMKSETVETKTVASFKKGKLPFVKKRPTVFGFFVPPRTY